MVLIDSSHEDQARRLQEGSLGRPGAVRQPAMADDGQR
jgi:hypothetical protein